MHTMQTYTEHKPTEAACRNTPPHPPHPDPACVQAEQLSLVYSACAVACKHVSVLCPHAVCPHNFSSLADIDSGSVL